jgi:predicted Rossmann-fold nucleotide-binding protein
VRAEDDIDLLHRDEVRPVRLQLEYLKTELALSEHGIESTIVLFRGTRIVETASAHRHLSEVRGKLAANPDDPLCQRQVAIAERVVAKSVYYDVAREFARLVSESRDGDGARNELVITTGGGPGIMEAGNRGALEAGRPSVGLNITLPMEQFANPYISPELCFQFRYFALRKLHFMKRAKAPVAFPGGYGTFDELFDALCLVRRTRSRRFPSSWSASRSGAAPSTPSSSPPRESSPTAIWSCSAAPRPPRRSGR